MQNDLQNLEILCQAFYGEDMIQRQQAHAVLLPMINSIQTIPQWQCILANSNNLQALLFAASCLTNLFSQHWTNIQTSQKEETRQFLMNYLYQRGPELLQEAPQILGHFIRLLCRIINLSWLDDATNNTFIEHVNHFLQASTPHWIIGLKIYSSLTQDILPISNSKMAKQRRIAIHFKENALIDIFKVGLQTLEQYHSGAMRVPDFQEEGRLLKEILQLTHNCLSFDFLVALPDETNDEQTTVMIPYGWTVLKSENIPKMFFDIYEECWKYTQAERIDSAKLCLSILLLIASIRRSFFNKEIERKYHINIFIEGTAKIIKNKIGLKNDDCYHELCRLLAKINSSSLLNELTNSPIFAQWAEYIFEFTIESMNNWQNMQNSTHYLLIFWSHMLNPIQKTSTVAPPITEFIKQVTLTFIVSRLKLAENFTECTDDNEFDNPLSNDVLRVEQLNAISELGIINFTEISTKVLELFQETQISLQQQLCTEAVFVEKSVWFVYIIGALIGGNSGNKFMPKPDKGTKFSSEIITGQMSAKVFELIQESNKYINGYEKLELAFLYFMEQFKRVFVEIHARKVVEKSDSPAIFEALGAKCEDDILTLMMQKICFNLQNRSHYEIIIKNTLEFFVILSTSINMIQLSSSKSPYFIIFGQLLLKIETASYILNNYSHPSFLFRNIRKYGKYRTRYMFGLSKLLFIDIKSDKQKFDIFMQPISSIFEQLWTISAGGSNLNLLKNEEFKFPIIGIARDLRGICEACDKAENYLLLFNWLINKQKSLGDSRIHLLTWSIDIWWEDCDVCIPILKFFAEFVHNKAQRISFEQSSNGVVLYREISSIHMKYGRRILTMDTTNQTYRKRYKTMATSLRIFAHIYSGKYIPFDLFEIYSDNTLTNSLKLCLEMCLAIPSDDLQAYLKSLTPYYTFLDLASKSFMKIIILEISYQSLAKLINTIEDGLCSFDNYVFTCCCAFINNIVIYLCNEKDASDEEGEAIFKFLNNESNSLRRILQLIFQIIISGEKSNCWMISGPLLGLILLYENEFFEIKLQYINQQINDEIKIRVEQHFTDLMKGIRQNFTDENKKLFAKNLYIFSQEIRSLTS